MKLSLPVWQVCVDAYTLELTLLQLQLLQLHLLRLRLLQLCLLCTSGDELHHEVHLLRLVVDLVELDDVGVLDHLVRVRVKVRVRVRVQLQQLERAHLLHRGTQPRLTRAHRQHDGGAAL